jgi:16S rRNA (cytosine1402-N4)-methyltransferase
MESSETGAFQHEPVLMAEVMELLDVKPGGTYVDGTLGLGGHAGEILRRSAPDGRLVGFDRDPEALARARAALSSYGERVRFVHERYGRIPETLTAGSVDGVLLDLGVSSLQLDDPHRGFSFRQDGPLDMRMNPGDELTAADVVNDTREEELADLIYQLGEDRASRRIARAIVRAREREPITTTAALARIVRGAAHRGGRWSIDPATRTFQALRIHVNRELAELETSLVPLAAGLKPHGRLAVISFHSLEDRIVKHTFVELRRSGFQILTKKPVQAGENEVARNPRARSAKLRAVERVQEAA